ncbi:MAG: indole-3-glycerol-phosphate synthase [Actinobacteria bacterium]|nr:indole-3-glycerol-phosphate synthase [Actinomycetota bacterium]
MATYLDRIIADHRAAAKADERNFEELKAKALAMPPCRGFGTALTAPGLSVVSEIKRRSPSKGALFANLDPATLARQYADGGAACMSVLTDRDNFGGSPVDLAEARNANGLPVIRKDFTVHEHDVLDARIMGADCLLLIVAALDIDELRRFHDLAKMVGLDVLVETHDEVEVEAALSVEATIIGVNQRDLVTFEVDHERAVRVGATIPSHLVRIAESGVRGPQDAAALAAAGFDAVLVGESLVTSGDPSVAVADLVAAGQ